jgi:hypothetical protein
MQVLSAAQALSPAIERTRRLLFQPFRWGTFLKLCAIAVFTEGFGGNFNFSQPRGSSSHPGTVSPPFSLSPLWIAIIAGIVVLSLLIGFLLLYLITRLRFALFHCLVYQSKEIRPGWRLYREPANRFFLLNLAVGLIFLCCVVAAAAPFVVGIVRVVQAAHAGAQLNLALLLSLALPLLALALVVALSAVVIDIVLRDLMLPHYALEDATAREAWAAVRARVMAEKGPFLLYAVLRVLLPIVAMMGLVMVVAIPMLILFGILALCFAGLHPVFAGATAGIASLRLALEILLGTIAAVIGLFAAISLGGPLSIWVRTFALLFYGGRYPILGNVLVPPPPPPLFAFEETPNA